MRTISAPRAICLRGANRRAAEQDSHRRMSVAISSSSPVMFEITAPRLLRRHELDALLAAPPRVAALRFFQRHQKSERRIFELQMTQHFPVAMHVALQKIENVT